MKSTRLFKYYKWLPGILIWTITTSLIYFIICLILGGCDLILKIDAVKLLVGLVVTSFINTIILIYLSESETPIK